MNPELASMSDDQIRAAADRLETLANDPAQMLMAQSRMSQMTPAQLDAVKQSAGLAGGADAGAGAAATVSASASAFAVGDRVELHGLSTAEFNGRSGRVVSRLNAKGRHEVVLDGPGATSKSLALRPGNLRQAGAGRAGGGSPKADIGALSVRDLKRVLAAKGVDLTATAAGMDRGELVALARRHASEEEAAAILRPPPAATPASASSGAPGPAGMTQEQLAHASRQMANADPATLRAQAQALRSMDPDVIRRSTPQMAHLSDAEIRQAADQMDQLASNPAMLQVAAQQLGNLTPEQLGSVGRQAGGAPAAAPGVDPAEAMAAVDPSQLKAMLETMKGNPEMLAHMKRMLPGGDQMSEEQLRQQLETLSRMQPEHLQRMMKVGATVSKVAAPALAVWRKVDRWLGGRLLAIVGVVAAAVAAQLLRRMYTWWAPDGGGGVSTVPDALGGQDHSFTFVADGASTAFEDDEFADVS